MKIIYLILLSFHMTASHLSLTPIKGNFQKPMHTPKPLNRSAQSSGKTGTGVLSKCRRSTFRNETVRTVFLLTLLIKLVLKVACLE